MTNSTKSVVIELPTWIESESFTPYTVASILQSGCNGGGYIPAIKYDNASETMNKFGDDVLEFIEDYYGELPEIPKGTPYRGVAVHFLSTAVEIFCEVNADLADWNNVEQFVSE